MRFEKAQKMLEYDLNKLKKSSIIPPAVPRFSQISIYLRYIFSVGKALQASSSKS